METTQPSWLQSYPELGLFDPYQGLIELGQDVGRARNLRYGYALGSFRILIGKQVPCEVVPETAIYPLPNTPQWVLGMINLRGNLVPIFDLRKRLLPEAANSGERRLLILDRGTRAAGIFIDGLPQALEINDADPAQLAEIPAGLPVTLRDNLRGAYSCAGTTWLEIDHRGLFFQLAGDTRASDPLEHTLVLSSD